MSMLYQGNDDDEVEVREACHKSLDTLSYDEVPVCVSVCFCGFSCVLVCVCVRAFVRVFLYSINLVKKIR